MDAVTEDDKLEATRRMQKHIIHACVKRAHDTHQLPDDENFVHYTFGFTQSVCIPHHSRQMGLLYFQTLGKVHIFGVRSDGEPKQRR